MAIIKISELPAATTPVSPSDITAVVQGGVTKKSTLDQLGFLQSGSNALVRGWQDKTREIVSVKDFGAVGDGTTDDATAIQNAINAGAGKTIIFPTGTYLINSPVVSTTSNVTIDFANATITNTVALPTYTLEGLSVNPIILLKGNNVTLLNGTFDGLLSQGIRVEGAFTGTGDAYYKTGYIENILISGLRFKNCVPSYLNTRFFRFATIQNVFSFGAIVTSVNEHSIGLSYGSGGVVANCQVSDGLGGRTIYGLFVNDLQYYGCAINPEKRPYISGLYYMSYCKNSLTSNCTAYLYSTDAATSPSNMKISHGENNTVQGCNFWADSPANSPAYVYASLQIQGCKEFSVVGNVLRARNGRTLLIYPHVDQNSEGGVVVGNTVENLETSVTPDQNGSCLSLEFSVASGFVRKPISITGNLFKNGNVYLSQARDLTFSNNTVVTIKDPDPSRALVQLDNVTLNAQLIGNSVSSSDTTVQTKTGFALRGSFIYAANNFVKFPNPAITGSVAFSNAGATSTLSNVAWNTAIDVQTKYSGLTLANGWRIKDSNPQQFTIDPGPIANGASASQNVTYVGVGISEPVAVSCSQPLQGVALTATAVATDTVELTWVNNTGGSVDLPSAAYTVSKVGFLN